jgi:hypothetical protein
MAGHRHEIQGLLRVLTHPRDLTRQQPIELALARTSPV